MINIIISCRTNKKQHIPFVWCHNIERPCVLHDQDPVPPGEQAWISGDSPLARGQPQPCDHTTLM